MIPYRSSVPAAWSQLDRSNTLLNQVSRVAVGTPSMYQMDLARIQKWTLSASPNPPNTSTFFGSQRGLAQGIGWHLAPARGWSLPTKQPPSVGWTIALIATPTATVSDCVMAGFREGGANDRELKIVSGNWNCNLYDGSNHAINSGVAPQVGRTDIVVLTQSASLGSIYVNNNAPVTLALATSGYQGYSNPSFFIGPGLEDSVGGFNTAAHLCLLINRPWTRGEAASFVANPKQIWLRREQKVPWTATAPAVAAVFIPPRKTTSFVDRQVFKKVY